MHTILNLEFLKKKKEKFKIFFLKKIDNKDIKQDTSKLEENKLKKLCVNSENNINKIEVEQCEKDKTKLPSAENQNDDDDLSIIIPNTKYTVQSYVDEITNTKV